MKTGACHFPTAAFLDSKPENRAREQLPFCPQDLGIFAVTSHNHTSQRQANLHPSCPCHFGWDKRAAKGGGPLAEALQYMLPIPPIYLVLSDHCLSLLFVSQKYELERFELSVSKWAMLK